MFDIITDPTDAHVDTVWMSKSGVPDLWILGEATEEPSIMVGVYANKDGELYTKNPYERDDFYKVYQLTYDTHHNEFIYRIDFRSKNTLRLPLSLASLLAKKGSVESKAHPQRTAISRTYTASLVYQDIKGKPNEFKILKTRFSEATVGEIYTRDIMKLLINAIP